jgi:hypothetical protein
MARFLTNHPLYVRGACKNEKLRAKNSPDQSLKEMDDQFWSKVPMPVFFVKSGSNTIKTLALAFLTLSSGLAASHQANAQGSDQKIAAVYKISYNSIQLGKLFFKSTLTGRSYHMATSTKLSVPLLSSVFNSLNWRGVTRTSGTVHGNKPRPAKYSFSFNNGKKRGKVDMDFSGNRVSRVVRVPDKKMSSAYVPVKKAHLKSVMDPMSAIMLIARKGNSHRSACASKIPIYDGKQRFNLKLSYKRSVRVNRSQSGGYAGPVIICRVRYQPVSGYKPHKKDIKFMVKNRGIELWLMPLPNSRNYAPYRFVLPLPYGQAEATLTNFNIRNGRGRQIALVQ